MTRAPAVALHPRGALLATTEDDLRAVQRAWHFIDLCPRRKPRTSVRGGGARPWDNARVWYTVPVLNVQATANGVFQTAYHVVWIPKYRRPILTGAVAIPLREILGDIATRNRWRVLALEIQPDHLHLFPSVPPTIAVAAAIRQLKGASARYLHAMCPQLRRICRSGHLWAPSYYVGSAGNVSAQTLRRYIERAVHVSSRR
jgi:putative transposase